MSNDTQGVSTHERYYVVTAGSAICVDCSDRIGWAVPWDAAEGAGHNRLRILRGPSGHSKAAPSPGAG